MTHVERSLCRSVVYFETDVGRAELVRVVVRVLRSWTPPGSHGLAHFRCGARPSITLEKYVHRLAAFAKEPLGLLAGLELLTRLRQARPTAFCRNSVFKLLAVAVVVGTKLLSERSRMLVAMAPVVGMQPPELVELERRFMELLDYRVHVTMRQLSVMVGKVRRTRTTDLVGARVWRDLRTMIDTVG